MKTLILLIAVVFLTLQGIAFAQNDTDLVNSLNQQTKCNELSGGDALATKTQPSQPESLIVVDSQGKEVGPYLEGPADLDPRSTERVLLNINGIWFGLSITINGFDSSGEGLFYTTTDCTGPAYTDLVGVRNASLVTSPVWLIGNVLYYGNVETPQLRTFRSQRIAFQNVGDPPPPCEIYGPGNLSTIQVDSFDLSTLGFVPPFMLQVVKGRRAK